MKTISIRELHAHTGRWVRETARYGEIRVTDHGRLVAALYVVKEAPPAEGWNSRPQNAAFRRLQRAGSLKPRLDSTRLISDERDGR